MSAAAALLAARESGITVCVDGDDLVLGAGAEPPAAVLDLLSRHKAGILALLRPARDGWSIDDWIQFFGQRKAIAEVQDGLPRAEAEARAFACCLAEWLKRNPVPSLAGHCLACEGVDGASDPVLPFGIESHAYSWLHMRCWSVWYAGRKAAAVEALMAMGITPVTDPPNISD